MKKKKIDYFHLLKSEFDISVEMIDIIMTNRFPIKTKLNELRMKYCEIHQMIYKVLLDEFLPIINREDIYLLSISIIKFNDSLYDYGISICSYQILNTKFKDINEIVKYLLEYLDSLSNVKFNYLLDEKTESVFLESYLKNQVSNNYQINKIYENLEDVKNFIKLVFLKNT